MGSTALAAAVPYQGKAIWISHKGEWSTLFFISKAYAICCIAANKRRKPKAKNEKQKEKLIKVESFERDGKQ